ncbi:MAG: ferrous iron transport protein A [Ignavibacteriales bacterium]|nr:ferrous iron transport protein A [Ignavibacteriales bacterium]
MQKDKELHHLNTVKSGQWIRIVSVPQGVLKAQFVRLGIHEGEKVKCLDRLPGGTIVLQKHRQHIAVGSQLAKQIIISLCIDKGMHHD